MSLPSWEDAGNGNTSYAIPQRRSRYRLAELIQPPMELRRVRSIRSITSSRPPLRPHRTARSIPRVARQAHPRKPAPPTALPKTVHKGAAPGTPRPRHQHEADLEAQKQKYARNCNFFSIADCRGASKRGLKPEKAANRTHSGPFPPRRGRKGVRNRKKVAQKSKFLFLRNESS